VKLSGESTLPSPAAAKPARAGADWAAPRTYPVRTEEDLLTVRHAVRAATVEAGFGLVDQTRVVTAASELARNAYVHGGGGKVTVEGPRGPGGRGLRLIVSDEGPGIADLDAALTDGFTTGAGLGHGLGGARRLMDEFVVHSGPGRGTVVIATRWTAR
jgi:serine/threonine-protein kinase RsbT